MSCASAVRLAYRTLMGCGRRCLGERGGVVVRGGFEAPVACCGGCGGNNGRIRWRGRVARAGVVWSVNVTTLEVLALLVLPVAAACWLGLLLRSLMDAHEGLWSLWLVLLAASTALWVYLLVELVP